MSQCPECNGPRIEDHPGGLVFKHDQSCELLRAEDARQDADRRELYANYFQPFTRPVTPAERALVGACGHGLPDGAATVVSSVVYPSLRRREWDGFEQPPEDEETT